MPIHVSGKQLVENGRAPAVIVRSNRMKEGYALIPESVYAKLRPLLRFVAFDLGNAVGEPADGPAADWTPEKNARRVALVNKKHDAGLTPAEKKELKQLMT